MLNVFLLMRHLRARSINRSEWRRKSAPMMGLETSVILKVQVNLWSIPKSRERVLVPKLVYECHLPPEEGNLSFFLGSHLLWQAVR